MPLEDPVPRGDPRRPRVNAVCCCFAAATYCELWHALVYTRAGDWVYPAVLLKVFSAEQPLSRRFTYLVGVDKNREKK